MKYKVDEKFKGLYFECIYCKECNILEEWDKKTYEQCKTRQQRRHYKSIGNSKTHNTDEFYYMCPSCEKWQKGLGMNIYIKSEDEG